MSAPGSAALLTLFRLSGTHRCCPTWGFGLHPSISMGVCTNAAVYFKAISPMTLLHRFLVSLHIHDTTYSFRISSCPLCSLLWIREYGTPQRSTLICNWLLLCVFYVCSISIRPDTLIFLTGERISVFFGAFCAVLLCWYLLTVMIPPLAFCFQMLLLRL